MICVVLQLLQQLLHCALQVSRPAARLRRGHDLRRQCGRGGDVSPGDSLEPLRVGHVRVASGQGDHLYG